MLLLFCYPHQHHHHCYHDIIIAVTITVVVTGRPVAPVPENNVLRTFSYHLLFEVQLTLLHTIRNVLWNT